MNTSILYISSLLGLCAIVLLTINFLLGILLAASYKRSVFFKRLPIFIQRINILQVHNWTAYVALILIIIHPGLLLFDAATKFVLTDVLIPFHSSYQRLWVALGSISFYAVVIVIITTQKKIKRKMGFRFWKNIHLISYGTALLMCLHGVFIDPGLKNNAPDFLDGEKLVSEVCFLILVLAFLLRIYYHLKNKSRAETPGKHK